MFLLYIKRWSLADYAHTSFNFKLNEAEADSIISKQFSVLSALQVLLFIRCAKMWDFLSVSKCSLILVDKWRVVSPM